MVKGGEFLSPLTLTQLDQWRLWRVELPLRYVTAMGVQIDVPAGFVSDGATIPAFAQAFLPTWGRYARAAVLHDYLYRRLEDGNPLAAVGAERAASDRIFFEAMVASGVNSAVRWLLWAMVRLFGKRV